MGRHRRSGIRSADKADVWALWVIGGTAGWLLVAAPVAVLIGRGVRLADRREAVNADVWTASSAYRSLGLRPGQAAAR